MHLSEELTWRGFIKDTTFADKAWLNQPKTFYHGIDGSSDSLTVGNLAPLMLSRHLLKGGWKAVLLVGGGTTLVGDPGGKESERNLPAREEVERNVNSIKRQVEELFSGQQIEVVNNLDWLEPVKLLDFLRDVGKHYSVTELIQRDFVVERIKEGGGGISFAEFSYSLIQGYDFWRLFKDRNVVMQVGGSDQWGNMLSGVGLIRKREGQEVHAFSMPLIVDKATGRKFGKSEAGAVWLDAKKTSPSQFYQFWINTDDADVEDYLKIFTTLPKDEVENIMSQQHRAPQDRPAQKKLAEEATRLIHGEEASNQARAHAASITSSAQTTSLEADEQTIELPSGISSVEALVKTGLAESNSEARRLLDEGAIYANNQTFNEDNLEAHNFPGGGVLLRRGKKFMNSVTVKLT